MLDTPTTRSGLRVDLAEMSGDLGLPLNSACDRLRSKKEDELLEMLPCRKLSGEAVGLSRTTRDRPKSALSDQCTSIHMHSSYHNDGAGSADQTVARCEIAMNDVLAVKVGLHASA